MSNSPTQTARVLFSQSYRWSLGLLTGPSPLPRCFPSCRRRTSPGTCLTCIATRPRPGIRGTCLVPPVAYPLSYLPSDLRLQNREAPQSGEGRLAEGRGSHAGGETVLSHGLVHLFDGDGTLLVGDDGFASLEAHLGLSDSLEPLQGPLDQDRSAASGHAVDPEVSNDQLCGIRRQGPEQQREP